MSNFQPSNSNFLTDFSFLLIVAYSSSSKNSIFLQKFIEKFTFFLPLLQINLALVPRVPNVVEWKFKCPTAVSLMKATFLTNETENRQKYSKNANRDWKWRKWRTEYNIQKTEFQFSFFSKNQFQEMLKCRKLRFFRKRNFDSYFFIFSFRPCFDFTRAQYWN